MLLAARIFALAAGTNGPEFTKIGICADLGTFGTTISSTGQNAAQAEKWRDPTIEFSKLINDRQSSISVAHLPDSAQRVIWPSPRLDAHRPTMISNYLPSLITRRTIP